MPLQVVREFHREKEETLEVNPHLAVIWLKNIYTSVLKFFAFDFCL